MRVRALMTTTFLTSRAPHCLGGSRKVDVRLPEEENSNSHGARPVHQITLMIKWIRTSSLSIQNSLSLGGTPLPGSGCRIQDAGSRVQNAGCVVQGAGCRVQGAECRVQDAGFRVQGAGCRFQDAGSRSMVAGVSVCRVYGMS